MSRIGSRVRAVAILAAVGLVVGATVVNANHDFPDVPSSPSSFHNAVGWMADRGITGGCGGGKFCPKANVTREQMALFMNRLGNVVSPVELSPVVVQTSTDLEASAQVEVCQTDNYVPSFEQVALITTRLSFVPLYAPQQVDMASAYRVNDGAWNYADLGGVRVTARQVGDWYFLTHTGVVPLTPGSSYDFATRLFAGGAGGAELDEHYCATQVLIFNGQVPA